MDALEAGSKQVKDAPPLPIRTYQWEDIRRARLKGGYPWTYLDKRPLDDNRLEDLIPYYLKDKLRKTQSSIEMATHHEPLKDGHIEDSKETKSEKLRATSHATVDLSMSENLDKVETPGPSKSSGKTDTFSSQRAKSEEPGRKRKHSINSSCSWVSKHSLSRLGFLKKLKAAKSKLKLPKLGFIKSDSKIVSTSTTNDKQVPKKSSMGETVKISKTEGPLYIHIPLKPPAGERDEFSYLEFEGTTEKRKDAGKTTKENKEDIAVTPNEDGSGVQLIILTAPSDDEILDTAPVLETPMGAENPFFESKDELKVLARDVVDKYSPETQRKMCNPLGSSETKDERPKEEAVLTGKLLDTSAVENGAKKKNKVKSKNKTKEEERNEKFEENRFAQKQASEQSKEETGISTQVVIDDEDGLKTETVTAQIIEEDVKKPDEEVIEATHKYAKESPTLKKKVSFKRKSKEDSNEIYEEVQVTSEPVKKEAHSEQEDEVPSNVAANPTPNLLINEQETKFHNDRVKGMTIAEEYEYWCRVNSNDYEPITAPDGEFSSTAVARPNKPGTPVTDSDIEFLASKVTDIELRTTGIIKITNTDDKSESVFVPLESVLKLESQPEKEVKEEGHGHKIQEAICKQATNLKRQASIISKKAGDQAEKLQTRVKSIKRPKIKMPTTPKFNKPTLPKIKIERPRLPNVKIADRMKNISLSLPRRGKHSKQRPTSTESTAGDSDKRNIFDFSTYPRIFRRKKREDDGDNLQTPRTGTDITPDSERTTLPRFKFTTRWKGKFTGNPASSRTNETIETPYSYKSKDSERSDTQGGRIPLYSDGSMDPGEPRDEREDSVERRMRMASTRYDDDIDIDDAYMKENQEIHRASSLNAKYGNDRWNHGTFHEKEADMNGAEDKPVSILKKKIQHVTSGSSDDIHRRGVLEEINSDEFFLRQKGISQDNIEVGAYLSSEIREAFRTPNNALSQLETAPPEAPKRRGIKKPKRKKTPHVSQEEIEYDQDSIHSEPEEYPQYLVDEQDMDVNLQPSRPIRKSKKKELIYGNQQLQERYFLDEDEPSAPPRKQKSTHSLNMSEHDSITGEINRFAEMQSEINQNEHEYQIPTPDPPKRPSRTRSRTQSRTRGDALPDDETLARETVSVSQTSLNYKSQICELPLPRRHSLKSERRDEEQGMRFSTVPRPNTHELPIRPLRNYSTLGPSPPPRKRSVPNMTDEEKNVSQYIEVENEDHMKNLHSGYVIKKMKDRPLPAPPRPPRRARDTQRRSRKNGKSLERRNNVGNQECLEFEAAVQTESVPDEFQCEELRQEYDDRIRTATKDKYEDKYAKVVKPRNVQEFEHQETITHGSLIVKPFAHDEMLPEGPIEMYSKSTERIVTMKREANSDKGINDDETSEIPEEFRKLQSSGGPTERVIEKRVPIQLEPFHEVEILKACKMQVSDLDVERLAVNELHASKITVGEIEGSSIVTNEISSNSGKLVVSGIELPASFFQQLSKKLQEQAEHPAPKSAADETPERPPRKVVETKDSETIPFPSETTSSPLRQPSDEGSVPQYTQFICESILDQSDHPAELTPFIYGSEEGLREQLAGDIDDVILTAQNVILVMEDDMEDGKKKTSHEAQLVEIANAAPQRPLRTIKPRTKSTGPEVPQEPSEVTESAPTPPPRPPQPGPEYMSSMPPSSFYSLRSPPQFKDIEIDNDIPASTRRRRHHCHHRLVESSSEDIAPFRRRNRTPEPSISHLASLLTRACFNASERSIRQLIQRIIDYIFGHVEDKHDVNVAVVILIVFIAVLFLIAWNGDTKQIHHHHWEYFNPPRDI